MGYRHSPTHFELTDIHTPYRPELRIVPSSLNDLLSFISFSLTCFAFHCAVAPRPPMLHAKGKEVNIVLVYATNCPFSNFPTFTALGRSGLRPLPSRLEEPFRIHCPSEVSLTVVGIILPPQRTCSSLAATDSRCWKTRVMLVRCSVVTRLTCKFRTFMYRIASAQGEITKVGRLKKCPSQRVLFALCSLRHFPLYRLPA